MKRLLFLSLIVLFCLSILFYGEISLFAQVDLKKFSGMKARSIGPAGMSGRIGAIEAVISDPHIIYVGAATGGLWKSTSGGTTWKPIFDDQPVSSIGAIAIYQPNPSIVWVGTGEGNPRNSMGVGYGIFKSIDSGETWKNLGLEKTERIHRIVLDPNDHDVAYVAALGTAWGENPERGVFKTTDGGKTWEKILFVNEKVGCADLVMDPSNPNKLFAAMWEYRRWPWFFKSGGPGSGLYVTYDGGENWEKITNEDGLPEGDLGRIGIGISRSNPDVVYALVEAKKSALCKSEDGGRTWGIINNSQNINPRPFYYCDIRVDPDNENRIYSLHSRLVVSDDGGKTFRMIANRVHSDHHALWINPEDGGCLIDGNDGGVAISRDRGETWRIVDNLPLGQFYHINVDMNIPYNIYGGMQDNGSWRGPSSIWENGGIRNYHWNEVGFGDGFAALIDPTDPDIGYAMSQGGNLMRFNLKTGERKSIQPDAPDGIKLRFNWNAGIAINPHDPKILYYGSQFLHKSTDRGNSWEIISPDLTTNDPQKQKQAESGGLSLDVTSAENHTTILTIAPSPVQQGVIWVGTDDGNVQVTRDGGKTWKNVVENIKNLPASSWCPHIEASKFEAGTAFAVFDEHRRSNWTTYIYKTEDLGKTWKSLAGNDSTKDSEHGVWGFAHVIEQDPVNKDLLYLGTEFGLYISFDGGKSWEKWTHGIPTVPVRALIVHPRDHDLVIGTHGRAAIILDDIRPLRTVNKEILEKPLHLFEIPQTYIHHIKQVDGYHFSADGIFMGENRPYGALISYVCNPPEKKVKPKAEEKEELGTKRPVMARGMTTEREGSIEGKKEETVKIEILDDSGKIIRKTEGPRKKGVNRFVWNLRMDGFRFPRLGEQMRRFTPSGPQVLPGIYTVKISMETHKATQKIEVKPDPRERITIQERQEKFDTIMNYGQKIEILAEAVDRIQNTTKAIDRILGQIRNQKDKTAKEFLVEGQNLKKTLNNFLKKLLGDREVQGIPDRSTTILWKATSSLRGLGSSFDAPTPSEMIKIKQAEKVLEEALNEFNKIFSEEVAAFKEKYKAANIEFFPEKEPLDINWKPKKK
ncbi:MAG: hypothetical protein ACETWK_01805 [Candidatus Aminicenantaceae bacterium]